MNIGRYQIQGELGKGGMGAVFLGFDPLLDRRVAIKCVRTDAASDLVEREELERRLVREAQSAARLEHPGIVTVYDVLQSEGNTYIVMKYVAGKTLSDIAPSGQRADPAFVARVLTAAAAALDHAHARNIIHRDIKPGNIMIEEDGTVLVADFGIAKIIGSATHTNAGVVVGTLGYMSPEQLQSAPLGGRADQYSLAVVGFQMLAGRALFEAEMLPALAAKIATEPPPRLSALNPALPAALDDVFWKALAKNSADRYATCAQFAAALSRALEGKVISEREISEDKKLVGVPDAVRQYAPIAAIFVAVAAIVIGAKLYFTRPKHVAAEPPKAETSLSQPAVPQPAAANDAGPPMNASAGQVWRNAKDGEAYVWIPPGSFTMGCVSSDRACEPDEKPAHDANIARGFWMGQTEASVAAYSEYSRATSRPMPPAPPFDANWSQQDHPIVQVTWQEAQSFCEWAGGRLPQEDEWEYAARGGLPGQVFPFGDHADPSQMHFSGDGGADGTAPVLSFRANGFSLFQVAGNAAEWTAGKIGDRRVVRGGSWNTGPDGLRLSKRVAVDPERRNFAFGIRCVIP